jgi:hypothetical protein
MLVTKKMTITQLRVMSTRIEGITDSLLEALDDEDPQRRREVLDRLEEFVMPAMPRLLLTALHDRDHTKRLGAIEVLGATPGEYHSIVMEFLMRLIFDPDDEIVDAAIAVINTISPELARG